jgi:hypothetical protein
MTLVHLCGSFCCGKSTLIESFKKRGQGNISSWDIKENFHVPHGITKDGKFDFDLYNTLKGTIEDELFEFLKSNADKIKIIESSGFNTNLNLALFRLAPAIKEIYLEVPEDLDARAEERGEDPNQVFEFSEKYMKFVEKNNIVLYSERQAKRALLLLEKQANETVVVATREY